MSRPEVSTASAAGKFSRCLRISLASSMPGCYWSRTTRRPPLSLTAYARCATASWVTASLVTSNLRWSRQSTCNATPGGRAVRFSGLLYFYGRRLRTRPVQELLAGVGIAIGVALVFAVQVANTSITDASSAIVRGIAGSATLQLRSRDANGFDAGLLRQVRQLPGVTLSAPILDESASLVGRNGRRVAIDLASAAPSLLTLGGNITRSISLRDLSTPGVILPSATADALGLPSQAPGAHVWLQVRGRVSSVAVIAVLGSETLGGLS